MHRSPTPLLIGVLVAALGVAGCGAEKTVKNAVDPVARAADSTTRQRTVQLSLTGSVSAAGRRIPLNGSGAVDFKANRGRLKLTTEIPGLGGATFEQIFSDLKLYLRSDLFKGRLPGGKQWVGVDLKALGAMRGIDLGQLQQLSGGTDPSQFLKFLKGSGDARNVGTETIRGTKTTHYRAEVDLRKVADKSSDEGLKRGVEQLRRLTGVSTLPMDAWVSDDGLVRRQRIAYSASKPRPVSLDFTIDYEKFGVAVDSTPPPAGDVLDAAALLKTLAGG